MVHSIEQEVKSHLIEQLHHNQRYDPHSVLGIHKVNNGKVIRLYRPDAERLYLEVRKEIVEAQKVHPAGLFEYYVSDDVEYSDYRVFHQNGLLAHDPYAFLPTFGDLDAYLFGKGVNYNLHRVMGGRIATCQGIKGVKFTVWAPSAKYVSLVGDFNYWDGRANPMRSLGSCGVFELFVPGLDVGEKYKFEIITQTNELRIKSDPYALYSEVRPNTASIVADPDKWKWNDAQWVQNRKTPHNLYAQSRDCAPGFWRAGILRS